MASNKRRRLDLNFGVDVGNQAKPTIKSEEATAMIEVGGSTVTPTKPYIGLNPDVRLSSNMSGIKTLQYSDMIWFNDLYTFKPTNSLIGLVVLCFQDPDAYNPPSEHSGAAGLWIFPIPLPWKKLTFGQGSTDNDDPQNTENPTNEPRSIFEREQDQLIYALNLITFNHNNIIERNPLPGDYEPYNHFFEGSGWFLSDKLFGRVFEERYPLCPIFAGEVFGDNEIPLQWFKGPNGELGIRRKGFFNDGSWWGNYHFALNFITIQPEFLNSNNFYRRSLNLNNLPSYMIPNPNLHPNPTVNISMLGDRNGWIGDGPDVFGVGSYSPNSNSPSFVDDYFHNPGARNLLFESTSLPYIQEPDSHHWLRFESYAKYREFLKERLLKEEVCMGPRIMSLIPSRCYTITSQALTRQQRCKYDSNNSALASSYIISLLFSNTISTSSLNGNSTNSSGLLTHTSNAAASNVSSTTIHSAVIHNQPNDPKQVIDFGFADEKERTIKNALFSPQLDPLPYSIQKYSHTPDIAQFTISQLMYQNNHRYYYPPFKAAPPSYLSPNSVPIPRALRNLNPDTVLYPDGDCLLSKHCLSQFPFFVNDLDVSNVNMDNPLFNISCPPSSQATHFVRLFGLF
jgi:hypothetical protein